MTTRAYLGLGSNLRSPTRQLHQAMARLRALPHTSIIKKSTCYRSKPYGRHAQPSFCNAVVLIATTLPAPQLLRRCLAIEKRQGRVRKKHWGARIIDIDLLLYGELCQKTPTLTLPHPGITLRDFVLVPLLELTPTLVLPDKQQALSNYFNTLEERYLEPSQ